ncbi:hypothetical protein THOM_1932 [Trachipleistophora hominis]|uniref:Uncharacterized protein n=1 Tax=Trachipleistophora hominis TaxID=72359 RepID=L7JVR7_TRAHO|nr:hypothetical protein THOM_1932 [Trachipleistophora hominis]
MVNVEPYNADNSTLLEHVTHDEYTPFISYHTTKHRIDLPYDNRNNYEYIDEHLTRRIRAKSFDHDEQSTEYRVHAQSISVDAYESVSDDEEVAIANVLLSLGKR